MLETALREETKTHAERVVESREKAEEHLSIAASSKAYESGLNGLKRILLSWKQWRTLADAAEPLYESLDNAQNRLFEPLLRKHVGLPDGRQ